MRSDLADFVRARRLTLGMSRGELARATGTSRRAVDILEEGADITAWPVSQLLDLAAALDVPASVLLEDSPATVASTPAGAAADVTDEEVRILTEIAAGRFSEQRLSGALRRVLGGLLNKDVVRLEGGRYLLSPATADAFRLRGPHS